MKNNLLDKAPTVDKELCIEFFSKIKSFLSYKLN